MKDPYRDRKFLVEELPKLNKDLDDINKSAKETEFVLLVLLLAGIAFDVLMWGSIFELW